MNERHFETQSIPLPYGESQQYLPLIGSFEFLSAGFIGNTVYVWYSMTARAPHVQPVLFNLTGDYTTLSRNWEYIGTAINTPVGYAQHVFWRLPHVNPSPTIPPLTRELDLGE